MNNFNVLSAIVSITSIILAIVAIFLSILFYCWSKKSNDEIQKATNSLEQTTKNIEELFDKLYTDTFSLMKSNIIAMQNRLFPQSDSESKTKIDDQKVDKIDQQMN